MFLSDMFYSCLIVCFWSYYDTLLCYVSIDVRNNRQKKKNKRRRKQETNKTKQQGQQGDKEKQSKQRKKQRKKARQQRRQKRRQSKKEREKERKEKENETKTETEKEKDRERECVKTGKFNKKLQIKKGRHSEIKENTLLQGENRFFVLLKHKTNHKNNKEGLGPSEVALLATSPDP